MLFTCQSIVDPGCIQRSRSLTSAVMGSDAGPGLLSAKALVPLAPALAASAGLATHRSAPVDVVCDPAEVLVALDGGGVGIYQDDLIELLFAVLCHPVRVQDLHVAVPSARSLLGDPLDGLGHGDGVYSHLAGLSVSLVTRLAAAAPSYLYAGNDYALLGLVAERPRPIQPGGPLDPLNGALLALGLEPALAKCAHVTLSGVGPGITDIAVKRLHRLTLTGSTRGSHSGCERWGEGDRR